MVTAYICRRQIVGDHPHQPTRSFKTFENKTCLNFPWQYPILSWLTGKHPTLADFMLPLKNRRSPDKISASVWWALTSLSTDGVAKEGGPKFNRRPGRGLNLGPSGWQSQIFASLELYFLSTWVFSHIEVNVPWLNCQFPYLDKLQDIDFIPWVGRQSDYWKFNIKCLVFLK